MDRQRCLRDAAARRRLEENVIHGLPVGSDPPELRNAMPAMDALFRKIAGELLVERNPFFDKVRSRWRELFPDLPAVPGRWSDGFLFLYVTSARLSFSLRPRLPGIRARLAQLEGAPAKFAVRVEIHAAARPAAKGGANGR